MGRVPNSRRHRISIIAGLTVILFVADLKEVTLFTRVVVKNMGYPMPGVLKDVRRWCGLHGPLVVHTLLNGFSNEVTPFARVEGLNPRVRSTVRDRIKFIQTDDIAAKFWRQQNTPRKLLADNFKLSPRFDIHPPISAPLINPLCIAIRIDANFCQPAWVRPVRRAVADVTIRIVEIILDRVGGEKLARMRIIPAGTILIQPGVGVPPAARERNRHRRRERGRPLLGDDVAETVEVPPQRPLVRVRPQLANRTQMIGVNPIHRAAVSIASTDLNRQQLIGLRPVQKSRERGRRQNTVADRPTVRQHTLAPIMHKLRVRRLHAELADVCDLRQNQLVEHVIRVMDRLGRAPQIGRTRINCNIRQPMPIVPRVNRVFEGRLTFAVEHRPRRPLAERGVRVRIRPVVLQTIKIARIRRRVSGTIGRRAVAVFIVTIRLTTAQIGDVLAHDGQLSRVVVSVCQIGERLARLRNRQIIEPLLLVVMLMIVGQGGRIVQSIQISRVRNHTRGHGRSRDAGLSQVTVYDHSGGELRLKLVTAKPCRMIEVRGLIVIWCLVDCGGNFCSVMPAIYTNLADNEGEWPHLCWDSFANRNFLTRPTSNCVACSVPLSEREAG